MLTGTDHGDPAPPGSPTGTCPFVTFGRPWDAPDRAPLGRRRRRRRHRPGHPAPARRRPPADRLHRLAGRLRRRRRPARGLARRAARGRPRPGRAATGRPRDGDRRGRAGRRASCSTARPAHGAGLRQRLAGPRRPPGRPRRSARPSPVIGFDDTPVAAGGRPDQRQPAARRRPPPAAWTCSPRLLDGDPASPPDHVLLQPSLVRPATPRTTPAAHHPTHQERPTWHIRPIRRARGGRPRRRRPASAPPPAAAASTTTRRRPAAERPGRAADPDRLLRRRRDQGGAGAPPRSWASRVRQHRHRHPGPGPRPSSSARPSPAAPRRTCSTSTPPGSPTTPASAPWSRTATRSATRATSTRACAQTFTYDGKLYCAPKDFSTLALEINTDLWAKAGLTDADVPTTWDQLTAVAQKLKAKGVMPAGPRRHPGPDRRVHGAGRRLDHQRGRQAGHRRQPGEPAGPAVRASRCSRAACAKYPKQLDAGWAGEAFGKGKAAMTIEGNWIKGAMQNDFPNIKYTVHPLPAGPKGAGHALLHPVLGHRGQEQVQGPGDQVRRGDDHRRPADGLRQGVRRDAVPPVGQATSTPAQFPADKPFIDGADVRARARSTPRRWTACWPTSTPASSSWPAATRRRSCTRLQKNTEAALGG